MARPVSNSDIQKECRGREGGSNGMRMMIGEMSLFNSFARFILTYLTQKEHG